MLEAKGSSPSLAYALYMLACVSSDVGGHSEAADWADRALDETLLLRFHELLAYELVVVAGLVVESAPADVAALLSRLSVEEPVDDPLDPVLLQVRSTGRRLLAAERSARRRNTVGYCAAGVSDALNSLGISGRGHAYQKANQLANNPRFREVNGLSPSDLRNLPPGAVVVWGRSAAKPWGHVSVALGGGREASDHIQSQITGGRYGTDFGNGPDPAGRQFRVFLPR